MIKTICIIIIFCSSIHLNGQTSASAKVNSRATIIDPIKITKSVDLDFGNVISAYTPGTVVLSPDGSRRAQGVQISNTFPGNVSPAEALVNHGNNKYSITLPESFTLYSEEDPNQILAVSYTHLTLPTKRIV